MPAPPKVVVPPQGTPLPDAGTVADERRMFRERHEQDMADRKDARELRKVYARRVFILCCGWVCAIFALLLFCGFGSYKYFRFHLSDAVVLAAIGSTTANIIGVFIIVIRFLFHDHALNPSSISN